MGLSILRNVIALYSAATVSTSTQDVASVGSLWRHVIVVSTKQVNNSLKRRLTTSTKGKLFVKSQDMTLE